MSTSPSAAEGAGSAVPTAAASAADPRAAALAGRDLTIDLARVACVLLVVVIHTLFVGVRDTPSGLEIEKTVELQSWFAAVTWVFEIMPLFFVVGGFASVAAYRSARRAGRDGGDYVRGRILRLARPALPVFAFFAIALGVVTALRLDPELVRGVAVGIGSPLWFLASFVLAQSLVPALVAAHDRRPALTLGLLAAAALAVDIVRWTTLNDPWETPDDRWGLPNVILVWAAVQQLGFWMHDGWFRRRSAWQLLAIIGAAYLGLWACVGLGDYSPNMLQNQYPPTFPLILLGLAQAAALTLLRAPLAALMRTRPLQGLVWWVGSRAMTIYCWHMPVILVLVGAMLLLPGRLTDPGSPQWWIERVPFVLAVLAVIAVLSLGLRRFEAPPRALEADERRPPIWRIAAALASFCAAPFLIMMAGLDVGLAVLGLAGTLLALALLRPVRAAPAAAAAGAAAAGGEPSGVPDAA